MTWLTRNWWMVMTPEGYDMMKYRRCVCEAITDDYGAPVIRICDYCARTIGEEAEEVR